MILSDRSFTSMLCVVAASCAVLSGCESRPEAAPPPPASQADVQAAIALWSFFGDASISVDATIAVFAEISEKQRSGLCRVRYLMLQNSIREESTGGVVLPAEAEPVNNREPSELIVRFMTLLDALKDGRTETTLRACLTLERLSLGVINSLDPEADGWGWYFALRARHSALQGAIASATALDQQEVLDDLREDFAVHQRVVSEWASHTKPSVPLRCR